MNKKMKKETIYNSDGSTSTAGKWKCEGSEKAKVKDLKKKIIEILRNSTLYALALYTRKTDEDKELDKRIYDVIDKDNIEIANKILDLFSLQKQEIIKEIKFTPFDVDDIMRDWTEGDWVDAMKDNRQIAELINTKIQRLSLKLKP